MKTVILTMYIILALLVSINRCIEETPPEKGLDIFYVGGTWADYARIQDAIDNASDGYSIFVFDGTYYGDFQMSFGFIWKSQHIITIY